MKILDKYIPLVYQMFFIALLVMLCNERSSIAQNEAKCEKTPGRSVVMFEAETYGKNGFSKAFGPGYIFKLVPMEKGWYIKVTDKGGTADLSTLTPPFHGPTPLLIEGWHFRNKSNTASNDGSVNVPQKTHEFIFSPEVAKFIFGTAPSQELVERIEKYGKGRLVILDYGLADLEKGQMARMVYLKANICLSWPE